MAAPAAAEPEVPADQAPTTLQGARARGFYITPTLALPRDCACVNDEAIWVLTSARPGNGIPQLLSDSVRGGGGHAGAHSFSLLAASLLNSLLPPKLSPKRSSRSTGSLTAPRRT